MKIVTEYISLEGYVIAYDISDAASNLKSGVNMYDTYEEARQSYQYLEFSDSKMYKVESTLKEY